MRVTVAARSTRPAATVSVHPPCGIWSRVRYEGQAKRATPPLQDIGLDRGGRLGAHLEYRQDLPAFPAVLRQAQPGRVRDADLRGTEFRVGDEIYERGLVSPEAAPLHRGRRPMRQAALKRISLRLGQLRTVSLPGLQPSGLAYRGVLKGPIPRRVGGRFTFERESRRPVVIAERIERIPGLPAVCGPIP